MNPALNTKCLSECRWGQRPRQLCRFRIALGCPARPSILSGLFVLIATLLVETPETALAQTPIVKRKTDGRQIALLIGVEKYQKVPQLKFVGNDVKRLAEVLRERGGFNDVVELSDSDEDQTMWPRQANVMSAVTKWLRDSGKNDTVVIYFSGHGFRDSTGKMYLAPLDTDPANLAGSGIPVTWLRDQIANCKAALKVLVLDACHAGTLKGGLETNVGPQDLEMFKKLEGVVTFASSTADQPSQMWAEKTQSLFTYWLGQGLKGNADEDGNGEVNIDELYGYVYRNVTQTAEARNREQPQTPVREIGVVIKGQPVVLYVKPQSLDQLLSDMAQQLSDAIAARNYGKVGVVEFTNNTKVGELLGANYGSLGSYCATKLQDQLVQEQRGRYKVVDQRTLKFALQKQKFQLADLGSGEALKELSAKAGGMPVIAVGMLHGRQGAMVNLRCQLIESENNEIATVVGGQAWLNSNQIAMLGESFEVKSSDRIPELPRGDEPPRPAEHVFIDRVEQRIEDPHPLKDPKFPYRLWLRVNGEDRKGEFIGNDYVVPLRKNEVFEIMIENRSGQFTFMRLLVDGLNTMIESDVAAAAQKGITTEIIGKPVNLDVAAGWVLDPKDEKRIERSRANGSNPNLYAVRGFVTKIGENGEIAPFKVVDAEHSHAARQNFTSQLGLITAAFYAGVPGQRGVIPDFEKLTKEKLPPVPATPGNLMAVVHIRYYDPDAPKIQKP